MKKAPVVFITSQVNLTKGISYVGALLKGTNVSSDLEKILARKLRENLSFLSQSDEIIVTQSGNITYIWVELELTLRRKSLKKEAYRFGKTLKEVGLARATYVCSPFKPRRDG